MSKSDQNQAKTTAKNSIDQNNQTSSAIGGQLNDVLSGAKGTASSILPGVVSNYADIMGSGGFDPSILGQINKNYTDLSTTGGISDSDKSAMYGRAANAARGSYDIAEAQAKRTAAATGGYGDTSAAVVGDLARKGSQAAERSVTDTTAAIAPTIQQGKIAGTQGLSNTQNQVAGNRLQATGGLTNIYGLNESQVNQTVDAIIRNFQTNGTLSAQEQQILSGLATQPGVFDKIVGTIGTLGGAAAGVIGATKPRV